MKSFGTVVLASLVATVSASTRFILTTDHKGVDGRNVTVGPPSAIAGDLIGALEGTPITFDFVNGEFRDSTGRDYSLALVGPSGGPYDLVGLASAATAGVPAGNVKIFDKWAIDDYLQYTGEKGFFHYSSTTSEELYKIEWTNSLAGDITELEPITV